MKVITIIGLGFVLSACRQSGKQAPDPLPQPGKDRKVKQIVISLKAGGKVFAGDHEWKGDPDSMLSEAIRIFKLDNNDSISVLMHVDSAVTYDFVHRLMKAASKEGARVRVNILQQ
jgi:biopolymer transport protein ExbD